MPGNVNLNMSVSAKGGVLLPPRKPVLYLIGSLREPRVPQTAQLIREKCDIEVFDDWYAAGERADDSWRDYEKARGRSFIEALYDGHAARHVFEYDHYHLNRAAMGAMVLPAGKSGHLELGYLLGQGKPGFILLDGDPDRFDVMYLFATRVVATPEELVEAINAHR